MLNGIQLDQESDMPDQSERLRRISNYSWHVMRADKERERANRGEDDKIRRLHIELAQLHLTVATDLSDAWRPFSDQPRIGESADAKVRRIYDSLLTALSEPVGGPMQISRPPSTITVKAERIT
jgi:hypothetical protein